MEENALLHISLLENDFSTDHEENEVSHAQGPPAGEIFI